MEENQNPTNPTQNVDTAVTQLLSSQTSFNLLSIAKWGKFLSIVGFITIGLLVIFAFSFSYFMGIANDLNPLMQEEMPFSPNWFGGIYLIFSLIYFFPTLFLFQFSTKLKAAVVNSHLETGEEAIEKLKSLFTFVGMLTAIVIGLYLLLIVGSMVVALAFV